MMQRLAKSHTRAEICGWFAKRQWSCCCITRDENGRLTRWQSGGRGFCELGHYLGSHMHYSWSGHTKLRYWIEDLTDGSVRGHVEFPNGKEAMRWSSYCALIVMPMRFEYDRDLQKYTNMWTGKPPTLWWYVERADRKRFEWYKQEVRKNPNYTRYHKASSFFSRPLYWMEGEPTLHYVPDDFRKHVLATFKSFSDFCGLREV